MRHIVAQVVLFFFFFGGRVADVVTDECGRLCLVVIGWLNISCALPSRKGAKSCTQHYSVLSCQHKLVRLSFTRAGREAIVVHVPCLLA